MLMLLPAAGCLVWSLGLAGASGPLLAAVFVGLAGGGEFGLGCLYDRTLFWIAALRQALRYFVFVSDRPVPVVGPLMFGFGYDMVGTYSSVLLAAAALFFVGVRFAAPIEPACDPVMGDSVGLMPYISRLDTCCWALQET